MFAKVYELCRKQCLPISMETSWDFFSSPKNLPKITPTWLGFEVEENWSETMYAGMLLKYYVRPIFGIRMRWVTEITHVEAPNMFVDEQRFGPYLFWHHQHHFRPIEGGVEVTDLVHWAVGYGPLGRVLNRWMVQPRVEEIFEYRFGVLESLFGRFESPSDGSMRRAAVGEGAR